MLEKKSIMERVKEEGNEEIKKNCVEERNEKLEESGKRDS